MASKRSSAWSVTWVHLEEDTGKTTHAGATGRIAGADYALEDYNRAGVPLVEVVSEPDMRSPEEARAYLIELRSILEALGVSDVRMEEGSLRCDANISVRTAGTPELGTKVEIKNLNSIRSLHRALSFEEERHRAALAAARVTPQHLADLLVLLAAGDVSSAGAKSALGQAFATGAPIAEIVEASGLRQVSDAAALEAIVQDVIAENPGPVAQFRGGKDRPINALGGQVMKRTRGSANPSVAAELLRERLST